MRPSLCSSAARMWRWNPFRRKQLSALIERFTTALSGCLEAMPVRQTAE